MEKRSEDDRPSSALSREIRPESEKCSDWSLSGGSDSETHIHKIYEWMCVLRSRGSRQNKRDTPQCNATQYNHINYDPKLPERCTMFEHYNLQGQYLLSFYWLLYLISLCCAGVSGVYTQQAHLCCFSVWIKLLVMGYNDTCDSTVLLRIKLNIYWLHATAVSKSQSYFLVRHVNKPINKRAHTQKKYPLGRGCQTQTWIKGQASPVLHSELEKK